MGSHKVEFKDNKTVTIDTEEQYDDEKILDLITKTVNRSAANLDIPVVPMPVLTFYQIKDERTASRSGLERKKQADMRSMLLLEAFTDKEPPYILATALHGGAHYKGLLVHVKAKNLVDVTVINSIGVLDYNTKVATEQEARAELYILEKAGYKIDRFTYKEHYIQPDNVDCGPTTVKNIEYELENRGQPTHATKLVKEQSILMRAQQAYQLKYSQVIPEIVAIDGKPLLQSQTPPFLTDFRQSRGPSNQLGHQDITKKLIEILPITAEQAETLYTLSEKTKKRQPEEHFHYIVQEFYMSNENIEKLVDRFINQIHSKPTSNKR